MTVIDAYLDLVQEGVAKPSVSEVAERSGVSHRSVFRYFEDGDAMARAAIQRQLARISPLIDRHIDLDAPLAVRVELLVRYRMAAFEEVAQVSRLVRSLARSQPVLQAQLTRRRGRLRAAIAELFAKELASMPPARAADTLAALDVLGAFESFDLLRSDQGLSPARTARVLRGSMLAMLGAPPDDRAPGRRPRGSDMATATSTARPGTVAP